MSFWRKLLAAFSAVVFFGVGAVTWTVLQQTRKAFEQAETERRTALVAQIQRELQRKGEDISRRVGSVAEGEAVTRMSLDLARGADPAIYVTEAKPLAESHQLEFLELLANDGSIVSSAQWPGRFGYKEQLPSPDKTEAFLKSEETPEGIYIGVFAVRQSRYGDLEVLGGERIDSDFLGSLALPTGTRALLYRSTSSSFDPNAFVTAGPPIQFPDKFSQIIERVKQTGAEASENVYWSRKISESEIFHAIPLKTSDSSLIGVLLIGNSRRNFVELQHHIRTVGFVVGGVGILLATLLSGWIAARVTKPIEELASASTEVAAGNWNRQVEINSRDEIGLLAESFNTMTRELLDQRERLVQSERVAAWRELARRLAHELKNPLFPLQITIENLLRARGTDQFDEVFEESANTLLAEIANLKTIIGRFSDFSKMPQPQFQRVQVNDIIRRVVALHEAEFHAPGRPDIEPVVELDPQIGDIDADPELLHRVIANLVLNAMDAMAQGGTLTLRTRSKGERARIEISDTGTGLTPEEAARLFTPYYTTKQHGTGLGLAIAQSVISDHRGTIAVESTPGSGATFIIELPKRAVGAVQSAASVQKATGGVIGL